MVQDALATLFDVCQRRTAYPGSRGHLSLGEPGGASGEGKLRPEHPVLLFDPTVSSWVIHTNNFVIHTNIIERFAIYSNVRVMSAAVLDQVTWRCRCPTRRSHTTTWLRSRIAW